MTETCPVCGATYSYRTTPDPDLMDAWMTAHEKHYDPRRNA